MSLFTLVVTTILITLVVASGAFFWFFVNAYIQNKRETEERIAAMAIPKAARAAGTAMSQNGTPPSLDASIHRFGSRISKPEFQPIDKFLNSGPISQNSTTVTKLIKGSLEDIPGLTTAMVQELRRLGYSSIEEIASWGKADVRAVSALLDIDQSLISNTWVPNAQSMMSEVN